MSSHIKVLLTDREQRKKPTRAVSDWNLVVLRKHNSVGPLLLVTPWYRPNIGGVVEIAERMRRLFTEAGAETHLLIGDEEDLPHHIQPHPELRSVWRFQIAAYVFYTLSVKSVVATLLRGPLSFWQLLHFVRRHRIKTIVLIYPTASAWPFLLLRRAAGTRVISSYHGSDLVAYESQAALVRWLLRRILRNCDHIIVPAVHLAEKAEELCRGELLQISVIPNCVDLQHFTPPPRNLCRRDAGPVIVHISNFAPVKRTLDIVEAFANAAIPPTSRLIMVGDGLERGAAVEHARNLAVDERVEFLGAQKDVRPFLWRADLLVMASDKESGPLALLEAMACGLPWIATRWGIATMIPEGECGLTVPGRSPKLLARAIALLINDPQRRQAMGRRGRARAEADFGEPKYVEQHLQLISDVESGNVRL